MRNFRNVTDLGVLIKMFLVGEKKKIVAMHVELFVWGTLLLLVRLEFKFLVF